MPVQDLTPQLRTRLSRVERVVGVFVSVATLLLLAGFAYYVYHTGLRKGWWSFKARYHTFVSSGAGLAEGSDVRLLGFNVGRVTKVEAMPPFSAYPVYVEFYVLHPYHGYIWSDSVARVVSGDFLGGRVIEVTPGGSSLGPDDTNVVLYASYKMVEGDWQVFNDQTSQYVEYTDESKGYPLDAEESPAVTQRLETLASQAELALPGILDLTNRINLVLSNVAGTTAEAQALLRNARPTLANVEEITSNLRDPKGSLGEWALPPNLHTQLVQTLTSANLALTNASQMIGNTDINVTKLVNDLDETLINLASITSNLNQQVQSNTNILQSISELIINTDNLVQGLKRHWFLRSAFKNRPEKNDAEEENGQPAQQQQTVAPPKAGKWR